MKRLALFALVVALGASLPLMDAEAKRLGGGGTSGMKRATPTQPSDASKPAPPTQQAAPAPTPVTPAAAPAAAPKRSWMGPLAGLAAGLGIAALASHFGMGGALANVMTLALLGVGLALLIGFLMRRFGGAKNAQNNEPMQFAGAGAPFNPAPPVQATPPTNYLPSQASVIALPGAATTSTLLPVAQAPANNDGFDTAAFEQIAKRVFIRLQAANDSGDLTDLRRFTTPEMFGVVQQELLDRKTTTQRTDVVKLDARVIERAEEDAQQIVSVRFCGLIREQADAPAEEFDETWHLVRPLDESRDWAIAGIQQTTTH